MERIAYKEGYKYQLEEDYLTQIDIHLPEAIWHDYIVLTSKGSLLIKKGYAWNGASGPTVDSKSSMRGSAVHDALYQLFRLGLLPLRYKQNADEEFYKRLKEDGMWWWRAKAWYEAVEWFGGSSVDPKAERPLLYAP